MRAKLYLGLLALVSAQGTLPAFPPQAGSVRWIALPEYLQAVRQNALAIRQAGISLRPAQWELYQAQANFLPSLNANASVTQNYGTTFDPFAFARVQQTTTFSSASLSASWILFSGLANHHLLRQARASVGLASASYRRAQVEVLSQALLQFVQTVGDSIGLVLAQQRIERLRVQLDRVTAQLKVGQALLADSLSLAAQIAREESQYLALYHRHRENKLLLLQLMAMEPLQPDSVEFVLGVEVADLGPLSEAEAIQKALDFAPELEEARWREIVQTYALRTVRAGYSPTLALSASLQTNYSSNAGDLRFDPVRGLIRELVPFDRQVRENFNQFVSLSLSVPIFQQLRRRSQVVRAEANLSTAQLQTFQQRLEVTRRTQQAYMAWQNALAQEIAARRSVEAAERAFRQARLQYENGTLPYWSFREALLTYTQVQAEYAQARLDLTLRTLLLGAYIGRYSQL